MSTVDTISQLHRLEICCRLRWVGTDEFCVPLPQICKSQHCLLRCKHESPRWAPRAGLRRHRMCVSKNCIIRIWPSEVQGAWELLGHPLLRREEEKESRSETRGGGPNPKRGNERRRGWSGSHDVAQEIWRFSIFRGVNSCRTIPRKAPCRSRCAKWSTSRCPNPCSRATRCQHSGGSYQCNLVLLRGQDGVGRPSGVDLRVGDGRCRHWVSDAQSWLAVYLLCHQARRIPRNGPHQSHRQIAPGDKHHISYCAPPISKFSTSRHRPW